MGLVKKINNALFKYIKLSKTVLAALIFGIFLIKLGGDLVFYITDTMDIPLAFFWKLITSFAYQLLFYLFIFKDFNNKISTKEEAHIDKFFYELSTIIYLIIGLIIVDILLPESLNNFGAIDNIYYLSFIDFTSIYTMFLGFMTIHFIYKWMWIRRHKSTQLFSIVFSTSIILFWLTEIPTQIFRFTANQIQNNTLFPIFSSIVFFGLFFFMLFIVKNNTWIVILPKPKKLRLLFLTLLGLAVTIIILVLLSQDNGKSKLTCSLYSTIGSSTLLSGAIIVFIAYLIRMFFTIITSLPTTKVVERKTSEISSLTDLNRLVAKTTNINELIDAVTKLALNASGGIASWTELYNNSDTNIDIVSTQFIEKNKIIELHKNEKFSKFIKNIDIPYFVESIKDNKQLSIKDWHSIPNAKAMVIIPLFSSDERIGSLIIIHEEEYSFELNDVKVLTAFSDNVSVALENARLLKDSIEKERFKRELLLAREIQQRLLPRVLPEINNYSIAAYSIAAEEVGGDYYDVTRLKNGKYCFLIGDVSGKGISAAFYMVQLKGVVLAASVESESVSELLNRINSSLYGVMEKQMYITLSVFSIDGNSGKLTLARAGHMPTFVKHNESVKSFIPKGIGIGLAKNDIFSKYLEEIEIELKKGDTVLFFTDGVNELKNQNNFEFGYEPLKQILNSSVYNNNADALVIEIKKEIEAFSIGTLHNDDMTVLALVYNG